MSLTLAVAAVVAILFLVGPLGASANSCSSYPPASAPAPAGARVSPSLASRYALFRSPQRAVDKIPSQRLSSLTVSGVIMSETRFLGDAGEGGRIYLVPAQHLVALRQAPTRCLSPLQRSLERESMPLLRQEYRQSALCLDVFYRHNVFQNCAPATGTPTPLLTASATPAFGLVPNGVSAVTVSYTIAPPRTVAVHHNFFAIVASPHAALPCGLQWLDPTGNVQRTVYGCTFMQSEKHQLASYRAYVAGKLSTLRSQVDALASAAGSGDLARARSDWLTAHMTWLAIGQDDGAYGCFGALGGQIDGLAAGHPGGTSSPGFTGFHRIEFDLWSRHDLSAAATDTATLQGLLAKLVKTPLSTYLPATANGIGAWVLRPHEVLEDALRDSLTANDDYGSGSDLASITADVTATRELLSVLQPVINPVAPHLVTRARGQLNALMGAIDATRSHGAWVSIQNLPIRQRQQVDADVGAVLETLAPIPDLVTSTGNHAPIS